MKGEPILMRKGAMIDATALFASDKRAEDALAAIPFGETVAIEIHRSRSNPQNRLYWAIVEYVAEGAGYNNKDDLHKTLLVSLGRYDVVRVIGGPFNGKTIACPQSTAFSALSQDEFQEYFDAAIMLICRDIIPGTDSGDLVREVEMMLGPKERKSRNHG
jgi:hypothetical protein